MLRLDSFDSLVRTLGPSGFQTFGDPVILV